jgi:hypothetical protein
VHLDAVDHRHLAALELAHRGLGDRVPRGRLLVVEQVAEIRVLVEHDERAAHPPRELVGAGAHRVLHDLVVVVLHHLARRAGHERGVGEQVLDEARAGLAQLELDRVAVDGAHALDVAVVLERVLARDGPLAQLHQAEDLLLLDRGQVRALPARVVDALERVHVVGGHQLAAAAVERRIVVEVQARAQPDRVGLEVGRCLGHPGRGARAHAHRPGEEFPLVERIEDVRDDRARVKIGQLRRVEARLCDAERVAQYLLGGGRVVGRARRGAGEQGGEEKRQGADEHVGRVLVGSR